MCHWTIKRIWIILHFPIRILCYIFSIQIKEILRKEIKLRNGKHSQEDWFPSPSKIHSFTFEGTRFSFIPNKFFQFFIPYTLHFSRHYQDRDFPTAFKICKKMNGTLPDLKTMQALRASKNMYAIYYEFMGRSWETLSIHTRRMCNLYSKILLG